MILSPFFIDDSFFKINIEELRQLGEDFPWPIPERCPCCGGRIWKHCFISYYLYPYYDQPFIARKLRCPDCRTTFRCRPHGYLPRFFYPLKQIKESLIRSPTRTVYKPAIPLETQRSWFKRLKKQIRAHFGMSDFKGLLSGFFLLIEKRIVPVSRSVISVIHPSFSQPTLRHRFQSTSISDWLE